MENPNFFKRNKDKLKSAVVGAGLMMGAMVGNAQERTEQINMNYDTIPNPITSVIDLDDIDVYQDTYPLEIPKVQAEWGRLNVDYYLSGRKYALQVNFNPDEIKIPENLSVTQVLYYMKGIEEGVKKFEASGQARDYTKKVLTDKEREKIRSEKGKKEGRVMLKTLKERAGVCGVGKENLKNFKNMK